MLVRALLLAVFPLLIPIGWLAWVRTRALHAAERDRTAAWFGYVRAVQLAAIALAPAWFIGLKLGDMTRVASAVFKPFGPAFMIAGIMACDAFPIFAAWIAIAAITADLQRRVRDVDQPFREALLGSVWMCLALFVVAVALPTAIVLYLQGARVTGVVLAAGGIVLAVKLAGLRRGTARTEMLTLTSGALRDRVFDLAARARVGVKSILVLPTSHNRMANAFAMNAGRLGFTDYLLREMDRREVDAIAAHELGHLRHGHPNKLALTMVFVTVPIVMVASQYVGAWGVAIGSVAAALVFCAQARRFERAADAAAVELTGDPEAVISGLAQLARLNHLPLEWNAWDGSILTHPSTLDRIRAVAKRAGIEPDRVRILIDHGLGARAPYEIPAGVSAERVFSAGFRARTLARLGWTLFALQGAIPAVVFALATSMALPVPRLALDAVALALTFAVVSMWFGRTAGAPYRIVESALRARFVKEGHDPATRGARFVGYAPTAEPRYYDGTREWDVGYLSWEAGALVFLGEEARFRLHRSAIRRIDSIADRSTWQKMTWIGVTWNDADGVERTFLLRALGMNSFAQARRATEALLDELRAWQEDRAPAPLETGAEGVDRMVTAPTTSPVSSLAMHEVAIPRALIVPVGIYATLMAFGFSALFGLPLGIGSVGGLDVFGVAVCAWALQLIPHWRVARDTRAAARAPAAAEGSERNSDRRAA